MNGLYVSYDGALDSLGRSQVVPYLAGLAELGVRLTLVSFEKALTSVAPPDSSEVEALFQKKGIRWRPLMYHKRPRVPATAWDLFVGSRAIREEVRRSGAQVVHCRGDVAMAMARAARLPVSARLLYDVRGFFSDERTESGSWRRGGIVDRAARWIEAGNLRAADAIVVLTERARIELAGRRPGCEPRVIPTCVDLDRYRPRDPGAEPEFSVVYSGSLGTWYMVQEMVEFAKVAAAEMPGRPLFLTRDIDVAKTAGIPKEWARLESVVPGEVPQWLRRARAAFFFIRPTSGKRASCPTKLGEALATGLPVVTNRGVGDVDALFEAHPGVGVLLDAFAPQAYGLAARKLARLLDDPATSARCRRVAEDRLGLAGGVAAYHEIYRGLSS